MSEQMELLRKGLDERGVNWWDMSDHGICPIERTRFVIKENEWSVIHGYGTYGGVSMFREDEGLLEVMTEDYNDGDPVGWLTAEQVLKIVDEVRG